MTNVQLPPEIVYMIFLKLDILNKLKIAEAISSPFPSLSKLLSVEELENYNFFSKLFLKQNLSLIQLLCDLLENEKNVKSILGSRNTLQQLLNNIISFKTKGYCLITYLVQLLPSNYRYNYIAKFIHIIPTFLENLEKFKQNRYCLKNILLSLFPVHRHIIFDLLTIHECTFSTRNEDSMKYLSSMQIISKNFTQYQFKFQTINEDNMEYLLEKTLSLEKQNLNIIEYMLQLDENQRIEMIYYWCNPLFSKLSLFEFLDSYKINDY